MANNLTNATSSTIQVWPYYISVIDYIVFFLVLGTLSGIWTLNYFRLTPRRRLWCPVSPNAEDLPAAIVAVSLTATFAPATIFLGIAAEIYSHGTRYWFHVIGFFVCVFVTAHAYLPVYFASGAKSTYDYIGKRFGSIVRRIIAATVILQMMLFLPFVLATPILVCQHVTNFSAYTSLVIMGIVLVPPTVFLVSTERELNTNSMRATTWNDAIAFLLTVGTLISITIIRMQEYGGFSKVWTTVENADLILFPEVSGDPFSRHTIWALLIGGPVTWCFIYSFNPCFVDRYLSIVTKTSSKLGLWCNFPFMVVMISVAAICGLTAYATFSDCDPIIRPMNLTYRLEEVVPLLVMRRKDFGFPGLFLGSIFGWTVGFVGSSINGLVQTTIAELVRPICAQSITEGWTRALHYIFLVIYTVGSLALVLTTQYFDNFLMASLGIFGIFGSPMLGVFTAALFIPWANFKGVIVGFVAGLGVAAWLTVGPFVHTPSVTSFPPLSISGCQLLNSTFSNETTPSINTTTLLPITSLNDTIPIDLISTLTTDQSQPSSSFMDTMANNETSPTTLRPMSTLAPNSILPKILRLMQSSNESQGSTESSPTDSMGEGGVVDRLSYLWAAPLSCVTVVIVTILVSLVTGRTSPEDVDVNLLCPAVVYLMQHLPCSRDVSFGDLSNAEASSSPFGKKKGDNDDLSTQRSAL